MLSSRSSSQSICGTTLFYWVDQLLCPVGTQHRILLPFLRCGDLQAKMVSGFWVMDAGNYRSCFGSTLVLELKLNPFHVVSSSIINRYRLLSNTCRCIAKLITEVAS